MRSSSRNSRRHARALGLATAASLLLGSAAQAADPSHSFVLTAFINGKGGKELMSGDYESATRELRSRSSLATGAATMTSNNRCVMLTVTKQWDSAHAACNQAVRDAQREKATLPSYQYWARKSLNDYLAVALSNRAVLHWVSADSAAAASDLHRAEALAPKQACVVRNRAALEYQQSAAASLARSS